MATPGQGHIRRRPAAILASRMGRREVTVPHPLLVLADEVIE